MAAWSMTSIDGDATAECAPEALSLGHVVLVASELPSGTGGAMVSAADRVTLG